MLESCHLLMVAVLSTRAVTKFVCQASTWNLADCRMLAVFLSGHDSLALAVRLVLAELGALESAALALDLIRHLHVPWLGHTDTRRPK